MEDQSKPAETLQTELFELSEVRRQAAVARIQGTVVPDGERAAILQPDHEHGSRDDYMNVSEASADGGGFPLSGSTSSSQRQLFDNSSMRSGGGGGGGGVGDDLRGAVSNFINDPESLQDPDDADVDESRDNPLVFVLVSIKKLLLGLLNHRFALLGCVLAGLLFLFLGLFVFDHLNIQAWLAIATVIAVFGLLAAEVTSIAIIFFMADTFLMLTDVILPKDVLAGFAQTGVATVAVLFVVAEGIQRTSMFSTVARLITKSPRNLFDAQARLMVPTAIISAFLNNTPVRHVNISFIFVCVDEF